MRLVDRHVVITTTRRMARWAREPIATFQPNAPFDRAEGRAEGEARGVAKGKAERKAEAVVAVLEGRGLAISDETRQTLLAGRDAEMLDRWLAPPARSPPPTSCCRLAIAQTQVEVLEQGVTG